MTSTTQLRNQAWRRMFLLRTCPPLGVLRRGGKQIEHHLASCSVCRENLKQVQLFAETGKLLAGISALQRTPTAPTPGDIRRVRPEGRPETWFDAEGRFHNPPLVLVLEAPDTRGFVRVAQIFDEPDLCGLGDIPLNNGKLGFAEAWNIYGLPVDGLAAKSFSHVDAAHAARVLQAAEQDFPALDTASALYHFRRCEMETGSFFSLALNAAALTALETAEAGQRHAFQTVFGKAASWLQERRARLQEIAGAWEQHAGDIALAAAEDAAPDDNCDDTLRRPCVLATLDVHEARPPQTLAAEVHVFNQADGTTVCAAYCPVPERRPVADAAVACGTALPDDIQLEWLAGEQDRLAIIAHFCEAHLDMRNLQITLLLSDGSEA